MCVSMQNIVYVPAVIKGLTVTDSTPALTFTFLLPLSVQLKLLLRSRHSCLNLDQSRQGRAAGWSRALMQRKHRWREINEEFALMSSFKGWDEPESKIFLTSTERVIVLVIQLNMHYLMKWNETSTLPHTAATLFFSFTGSEIFYSYS